MDLIDYPPGSPLSALASRGPVLVVFLRHFG
jgi:hypothetical protein